MTTDTEFLDNKRRRTLYWFQLDVRELLNHPEFLDLSRGERGLLFSMMVFYWWRGPLPLEPGELARTLQVKPAEVRRHLAGAMDAGYFLPTRDGLRAYAPELEELAVKKEAEYDKKRKGGEMTNRRRRDDEHLAGEDAP